MTRAVRPERATLHLPLHLRGSGTSTIRIQCRQPHLPTLHRSQRIDAPALHAHLPGIFGPPLLSHGGFVSDCCRVRPSADAHGIVLILLCLLCPLGGGGVWWCRRQGTKRRADQQQLCMEPSSASAISDSDF